MEEGEEEKEEEAKEEEEEDGRMRMRCSHITTPTAIYTTPLLTDLDHDGQLDIVYLIVWTSEYEPTSFKTLVVASNLEELFKQGYGAGILDFDIFLPPSKQPWTQYMGARGDNVFKMLHNA
jgi:hypothetical protein